jgi:hypothetical protein
MIFNRRDFLKDIIRNGLLSGLGILAISLFNRSGRRPEFSCPPDQLCRQCRQLPHCDLPRAGAARGAVKQEFNQSEEIHGEFQR